MVEKKAYGLMKELGLPDTDALVDLLKGYNVSIPEKSKVISLRIDIDTYSRIVQEKGGKKGTAAPPTAKSTAAEQSQPVPKKVRRITRAAEKSIVEPATPGGGAPVKASEPPRDSAEPRVIIEAKPPEPAKVGEVRVEPIREAPEGRRRALHKKVEQIVKTDDGKLKVSQKRVFRVKHQKSEAPKVEVVPFLKITGAMTIRDLSTTAGIKVAEIIGFLINELDILATINYQCSPDELAIICEKFGIKYEISLAEKPEDELEQFEVIKEENLVPRPPIITVMGHVDHGKTKLLDAIREANVVAGEAGGITQHIGAYQVILDGKRIIFIDTPGHAAFTQMRARGSQVTDIVILVVAADDGVMPQTVEAIDHAKAAGVPIIVAVNKIDKAPTGVDRVKSQLADLGIVPDDWGGQTSFVPISAIKGENIDKLLEVILITAEILELKADPKSPPSGVVIESSVDAAVGIVATVIVRQGSFRKGHYIICGTSIGKIKRMENEKGATLESAPPATPVKIFGFNDLAEVGHKVYAFHDKKRAYDIVASRLATTRSKMEGQTKKVSLEDLYTRMKEGEIKELRILVKTDVSGTAEALNEQLEKLKVEDIKVNVIRVGVGVISESDVLLASASNAIIVGFNTTIEQSAKRALEREKVDVRLYEVIFQVVEDIEKAMKGLLAPILTEVITGSLRVKQVFRLSKDLSICGGEVIEGKISRGNKYRIKRGDEVIFEGILKSLRRFKDDVREVGQGMECGIGVEGFNRVEEGDLIEFFIIEEVKQG